MAIGKKALEEIPGTMIQNCVSHVLKIEEEHWKNEGIEEIQIEPIIIPLIDEDDDDDEGWGVESDEVVSDIDEDAEVNVWD
jgi:hypothetical protein